MVLPKCNVSLLGGASKSNQKLSHNFPKRRVRKLSRKKRRARRKRDRNLKEKKVMTSHKGQFDYFWGNYYRCFKWAQNHHASYWKSRAQALEYENKMLRTVLENGSVSQLSSALHSHNCKSYTNLSSNHVESGKWSGQSKVGNNLISQGHEQDVSEYDEICALQDSESENEFEFEVDDAMIAFFTQSMKHKMELQRERDQNALGDYEVCNHVNRYKQKSNKKKGKKTSDNRVTDNEETNIESLMCLKRVLPTQSFVNNQTIGETDMQDILQRKAEREEKEKQKQDLYGKSASKILGMETALQLNFKQICLSKKPVVWPIIPLNL